jgi:hypothetical protein
LAAVAISGMGGVGMQFRIGDRDPETGLYNVIWPDGSSTLNGIKIYNAAHETGDVVLATQRSDGMMILDSAKAVDIDSLTNSAIGLGAMPQSSSTQGSIGSANSVQSPIGNYKGYLGGQLFNDELMIGKKKAFLTNYETYLLAASASFPLLSSIANTIPPVATWIVDFPAVNDSVFYVVYPRTSALTKIVIELSLDLLPIDETYIASKVLYVGPGRDLSYPPLLFASGCYIQFYTANNLAVFGNKIEFTVPLTPNPTNSFLGDYDSIQLRFVNFFAGLLGSSSPNGLLSGKTVTFTLVSVSNCTIANNSCSIFIPS